MTAPDEFSILARQRIQERNRIEEAAASGLLERNALTVADVSDRRRYLMSHDIQGDRHTLILARVIDVAEFTVGLPTIRFGDQS